MGSTLGGPANAGVVVQGGNVTPYQRKGAKGGSPRLPDLLCYHRRPQRDSSCRQHYHHVLHKQAGWWPFLSPCREALLLWEFCIAHSVQLVASYIPEVQKKMADSLSRWLSSARMDVKNRRLEINLPEVGISPNRSLCHQGQQPMPSVLFLPEPQLRLGGRCLHNSEAQESEVCLPTTPTHPQSPAQGPQGQRGDDSHRSGLTTPALVYNPAGTVNDCPNCPAPAPRSHHAGQRSPAPPEPTVSISHGVEYLWLNAMESRCSRQIQQILLGSRKLSTRAAYLPEWKRFSYWCKPKLIQPLQTPSHPY
nr:uncharacterized protein LOC116835492 [Chelonoidis abingdonii]XP_032654259.1 uncharacterized protein LOC116835492 [Chelonoidis abingdonii]XP_032654260.1 uncharacterized protein LOC116835492 [Chelonoidis abingdonii]